MSRLPVRSGSPLLLSVFLAISPLGAQSPSTARPAPAPAPRLRITQRNVTAAADSSQGAPRTTARPGDVIRYTLSFTNPGARAMREVTIGDPIPAGVRFMMGSGRASRADARLEFSIDSGRTWLVDPRETVVVNGQQLDRPVSPSRLTNVRWVLASPVAPRETVTAEFSARVVGSGAGG